MECLKFVMAGELLVGTTWHRYNTPNTIIRQDPDSKFGLKVLDLDSGTLISFNLPQRDYYWSYQLAIGIKRFYIKWTRDLFEFRILDPEHGLPYMCSNGLPYMLSNAVNYHLIY